MTGSIGHSLRFGRNDGLTMPEKSRNIRSALAASPWRASPLPLNLADATAKKKRRRSYVSSFNESLHPLLRMRRMRRPGRQRRMWRMRRVMGMRRAVRPWRRWRQVVPVTPVVPVPRVRNGNIGHHAEHEQKAGNAFHGFGIDLTEHFKYYAPNCAALYRWPFAPNVQPLSLRPFKKLLFTK